MREIFRKAGEDARFHVPLISAVDGISILPNPGALLAAGDVKVSKMGLGSGRSNFFPATLPVTLAGGFIDVLDCFLSAAEMTINAAIDDNFKYPIIYSIVDQTPAKVFLDTLFSINIDRVGADIQKVKNDEAAATNQFKTLSTIRAGAVTSHGAGFFNTADLSDTNLNNYKGRWVIMINGACAGQAAKITKYIYNSPPETPANQAKIYYDSPSAFEVSTGDKWVLL